MQKRILFLLSFILVIAASANADVLEPALPIVKLPHVIKKPGTYVVADDLILKGTTGTGITIEADNVVLDLGEHTITNVIPATSGTVTVAVGITSLGYNNITVRHGTVTGFYQGVVINSGTTPGHTLVENVTLNSCLYTGVNLTGDIEEVRNCRVELCGEWGLLVDACNFGTMADNEVVDTTGFQGNPARGIQIGASTGCVVKGNRVVNLNAGFLGISIFAQSGYSFASDNVVSGWDDGLTFANGSPGKYLNNLTENCTTPFSGGTAATGNN
jgi:hypothetical protein